MNARCVRLLCSAALALTSLLAHAQYSWIDDKGMRVFSDRPAPPGTPTGRILKTPRGMDAAPLPAAVPAVPDATPDWKKREEEYKRRSALRTGEEEKAKLAARDTRRLAHDIQCVRAREAQGKLEQLETARFQRWNNKGERDQLPELENRQREMLRLRAVLAGCVPG
ncbi:hypothetical protein SRABI118_00949 [Massilia sp. Bi118]|uniref:DUF4124 domain-containing protein n=1 Tax=Massilia sp. Bi118 TaxID=2822346 RepID=UPI001DC1ED69|nr:DUF4124 domain-containing protein [Massilia sp. Bi118]CAH0169194.1 hypothetical protein SRABI118_00949 [Massilia sp. Bi118]